MAKKTASCDTRPSGKKGGMTATAGKMQGKMAPPFQKASGRKK